MVLSRLACVLVPVLALLVGCGGRPLHVVLKDADHAYQRGDYAASIRDYATYVERRPDEVHIRYRYGKALIAGGQARTAVEQLNICTDVSPLNDAYLDAQAQAMYDAGEAEALQTLLARASSERGRVTDYLRQGHYAVLLGNLDEARQALITAAKLDQGASWQVQRELADFYGRVGDTPRQVRRLRMAFFLNPDNPELLAEIRRVGEVPGPTFGLRPEEIVTTATAPE
ncbi:MAG: hypothetical protein HBSAPP03_01920 [Phycisphaerae bacterium]|nr:MAG: hypothetical protein HBSAPP03_01920 [Phycisphaerae bacterium]